MAAARQVVGLPTAAAVQGKNAKRRGKKASAPGLELGTSDTVDNLPLVAQTIHEPATTNGVPLDTASLLVTGEEVEEEKRFSAVSVLQKRIKAHNKKLQRIISYEAEPNKLNPDQQKAVASKPAIELGIKELQELVAVFQAEEAEEEKRLQRREQALASRVQTQVQEAVSAHDAEAEVHLAFLLQFLHLRSLFRPEESGFAPPVQPPVVANATSQEFAAVMTLFDALANGPLTGGGEDALQRVKHLYDGSAVEVLPGVDYGRIKQMIGDLTAPPHEVAPPAAQDNVVNEHVNGIAMPTMGISFMQASDIAPDPVLEPAIGTPDADPFSKAGPAMPVFDAPATNWADDVDAPAPDLSLPAPVPGAGAATDDSFKAVGNGQSRGRNGPSRGRGRGRGEHRGGPRRPNGEARSPREDRPKREGTERADGETRGRGRGKPRGRGRGQGGPPSSAPAVAAA